MADQVLIADGGVPQCLAELDPSLTRGANFGQQLGVTDAYANVKWFGAVGDGVANDAPAIRLAVDYALANGRVLYFPAGTYGVAGADSVYPTACIYINSADGIEVVADMKATIKPLATYGISGASKVVRIEGGASGAGKVSWTGGKLDVSSVTGSTTGADALSIGPKFGSVVIDDVVFDHGVTTASGANLGTGGGDSSLFIKEAEHIEVTGCKFLGAPDLGIYLSGDFSASRNGRHAKISGNHFYRCGSAASVKRGFEKCVFSENHVEECLGGFFSGVADGQTVTGNSLIVVGNTFTKTQGNPMRLTNTTNAAIVANEVVDWRRHISDGSTETAVSSGNIAGAIILEGSARITVTGNTLGFKDWARVTTGSKFSVGVSVTSSSQTGGVGCSNVTIVGNTVTNVESGFYVNPTSSDINILGNDVDDVVAQSRLQGTVNVLGGYKSGGGTVGGYIEIKDAGGTVRKLAVIT